MYPYYTQYTTEYFIVQLKITKRTLLPQKPIYIFLYVSHQSLLCNALKHGFVFAF